MDHHQEQGYKLLEEEKPALPSPPPRKWKYGMLALATIALVQFIALTTLAFFPTRSYSTGFTTDFPSASSHIALKQARFTSPIRATPNGTLYRIDDPNEPTYTGDYPEEQLNAAWDDLIGDRYFPLTDHEITRLNADAELPALEPIKNQNGTDWFLGGVDALHSLHCLDALRRHMRGQGDHMGSLLGGGLMSMHLDHCIDQLRQTIMCSADLTPVTLRPVQTRDLRGNPMLVQLGETERVHTCRDFGQVKDWVKGRVY